MAVHFQSLWIILNSSNVLNVIYIYACIRLIHTHTQAMNKSQCKLCCSTMICTVCRSHHLLLAFIAYAHTSIRVYARNRTHTKHPSNNEFSLSKMLNNRTVCVAFESCFVRAFIFFCIKISTINLSETVTNAKWFLFVDSRLDWSLIKYSILSNELSKLDNVSHLHR